jgi:hypothetical protein
VLASGKLACSLGCYLPTTAKGKTNVYAEDNPDLLGEKGALKSQEDWNFLHARCTETSLLDGMTLVTPASDGACVDTDGQTWRFPTWHKDSCKKGSEWESYLCFCRKGLIGMPSRDVFDIKYLKPEALHAVIKPAVLLADLGESLALMLPVPIDLTEKLRLLWGWYKPHSGCDASSAAQSTRNCNVKIWGKNFEGHQSAEAFIKAVQCMSTMVSEAIR